MWLSKHSLAGARVRSWTWHSLKYDINKIGLDFFESRQKSTFMEHHPVEIIDDKTQYSHHLIVWSFRDFSPNFLSDDKLRLKLHFSLSGDSSVEINSKFCACLTSCCSLMRDVYSCKNEKREEKSWKSKIDFFERITFTAAEWNIHKIKI